MVSRGYRKEGDVGSGFQQLLPLLPPATAFSVSYLFSSVLIVVRTSSLEEERVFSLAEPLCMCVCVCVCGES